MSAQTTAPFDLAEEGRYIIRTDPHGHYLPEMDDGATSMEMTLAMGRLAAANGFANIVATPHSFHPCGLFDVHADKIRESVDRVNREFAKHDIAVKVYPGMELLIAGELVDLHREGKLVTWADQGRYLLMELGFHELDPDAWDVLDYFRRQGLTPIVAHPERYTWLRDDKTGALDRLVALECFFQVNVMSINGLWGAWSRQLAFKVMRTTPRWIVGTDSHSSADKFWGIAGVRKTLEANGFWPRS